ncbi:MAG: GspH/FimT family pseudopilin [Deltaproteobacteria bacterium]|nr:GspH/FimT family pseudopilin [Deltaproteobacteria bacterium]
MKMLEENKGFSLVELLLVIALIGVMVAIAVPSILRQIDHQRLVRSARDLFTEINAARTNAITRNVRYEIDVAGTTYQLKYFDTASWVNEPGHTSVALQSNISITSPAGAFQVVYNPNGTVTVPGNICLTNTRDVADRMSIQFTGSLGRISIVTGC